MRMRYLLIAGAAALALGLAGCGSSGDDDTADAPVMMPEPMPEPMPVAVDLMGSGDLSAGMTTIAAGDSVVVGYTTISCAAGGADCALTVTQDDVTGAISASSLGGMLTVAVMEPPAPPEEPDPPVATALDLMGSEDLMAGMTTLAAGESITVGRTTLSCAADGEDCSLTVMVDDVTGTQRASSTGGMVTVEVAAPPAYADLGLPMGNTLTSTSGLDEVDDSEAINIAVGESVVRGGVLFSCPADGDACRVMIQNEAGTAVARYTGGTPTATVAVPPATVALPSGHNLATGTVPIPAGGTYTVGGTVVSCPAGGMACTVTISQAPLGGPIVGSSSGGTATVALAPSPSWTDARAGTVDGAINPTTAPTPVVTTDASGAASQASATQLDITEIMVNAQGTSRIINGTRTPPQRFGAPVGSAPSIGAGWNGLVFERDQAMGATQRVAVYNDRMAPAAGRAFSASFSGTDFNSDPRMVDSTDAGLGTRYGATFASLSMSASFPAAPPPGQLASASYITTRAFPGTFAGVDGMFSCVETSTGTCAARNDTVTGLVLNGGTWTFTATNENDVATVSDGNYFTMGWWMNEPLAANGAYTFGTFQTATNPTDGAVGDTTSGTASYAGAATGLYSSRGARNADTMRAGAFNADASLTANFDNNMLSGSIANFRDQNGAAISGWVVSLDQALMADGEGPNNNATGLSNLGTTSGAGAGGLGWSGNWNAWLVGDRSAGPVSHPNAVVGNFNAQVGRTTPGTPVTTGAYSSVSGVFGAN